MDFILTKPIVTVFTQVTENQALSPFPSSNQRKNSVYTFLYKRFRKFAI